MPVPNYTDWSTYLKNIQKQGEKRSYAPDPKPTPKKKKGKK
jgi:hypothetical protein